MADKIESSMAKYEKMAKFANKAILFSRALAEQITASSRPAFVSVRASANKIQKELARKLSSHLKKYIIG